ncbi:MAG: family 43 glycosylhydrolase [Lachnospiraceae bacterium]|nr:family 43 glycosylhydrolase [Lachnospiraceae bacterium]
MQATVKTEYNEPLIPNRADPYVCKENGLYYFTASVPEYDRIVLRCATTIKGLAKAEEKEIWHCHETGKMAKHIWAPELHYVMGGWYIYFAAGENPDIWAIRPYVLKCTGNDPMKDDFVELGMMQAADDDEFSFKSFSLDMTVFEANKEWYCVWAEKVGVGKMISNLYIAKLETPNKLKTVQVLLTTPDYDWERIGFWVNEGPYVLKHDGKLFLTFSASATGACYCVGMLAADENADLLDPRSWEKFRDPVLKTDYEKHVYGPGHNCFVKSEDDTKDIMIYHARPYEKIEGDPLYDPNRHTMMLTVEWKDGLPVFNFEKQN